MREKLIELENDARMNAHWHGAKNQIEYVVDHLIANGVTIPVRCRDCEYYQKNKYDPEGAMWCKSWSDWLPTEPDDFCSYGKRRNDG